MSSVEDPALAETLLRTAAEHSLRAFLEPNAVFLAERLHLCYPSSSSAHLLATAHLRSGNYSRAADVLRPASTPDNRYLYAVCLSRIGTPDALRDAEAHLRGVHGPIDVSAHPAAATPGGAAGLHLLADICLRTGRKDEAVGLFRKAVQANPTLWVAFDALANMGIVANAEHVLGNGSDAEAMERLLTQPQFASAALVAETPRRRNRAARERPASVPAGRQPAAQPQPQGNGAGVLRTPARSEVHPASFATPSPMPTAGLDLSTPAAPAHTARAPPRRATRRASPLNTSTRQANRRSGAMMEDSHVRNPNDLFATPTATAAPPFANGDGHQPSAQVVDAKAPVVATGLAKQKGSVRGRVSIGEAEREKGCQSAMELMRALGQIMAELGRFRCARTLELTECLPKVHRHCGMVLSIRGRAFLEKGEYAAAEREFLESLRREPTRLDGIVEYYSTVLWHLKKEKELAQLAIRAQCVYPVSSSAWCAAGNCFSLQRDPDAALKFLQRAIATSKVPNAYPYTLAGHEYMAKENFEAALSAYRQALHIDERNYKAMYGIGQVLQKQEKFGLAQSHFRSAVLIHPLNANLHYHLGMALAAAVNANSGSENMTRGTKHALIPALAEFETASNLDPGNPVPRFERAKILVALNRLPEARRQLESLRDLLPKEAEVYYELSRVCKRMGDVKMALRAMSIALDIEPKERKYKKGLETLSNEVDANGII